MGPAAAEQHGNPHTHRGPSPSCRASVMCPVTVVEVQRPTPWGCTHLWASGVFGNSRLWGGNCCHCSRMMTLLATRLLPLHLGLWEAVQVAPRGESQGPPGRGPGEPHCPHVHLGVGHLFRGVLCVGSVPWQPPCGLSECLGVGHMGAEGHGEAVAGSAGGVCLQVSESPMRETPGPWPLILSSCPPHPS